MPTKSLPRIALALLLAAYAVVLVLHVGAVPGGSDPSGYFNEARLFASGRLHAEIRAVPGLPARDLPPFLYVPLGFKPAAGASDQMVPTYPPGLSLLLVPAARLVGWEHAGDLVLILHSLAGIALTFALGRRCGLPAPWSAAGALVLAASPLYLYSSLWAMSDVPAAAWATAAILAAWKSRDKPGWALISGLCVAVAFLVRPNNFLIVVPIAIVIGLSPVRLLGVAIGALPGIAAWMAINRAAYGAALQSGYGAIGNEFHRDLIPATLAFCVRWLPVLLSPIIVAAPVIILFFGRASRVAAVLAVWIALYVGFYLPYRFTHEDWWYLRFLLPAAPALIVAGLVVLEAGRRRYLAPSAASGGRLLLAGLLMAAVAVEAVALDHLKAWKIGHGERKYLRSAARLEAHAPGSAIVVATELSGSLYYYTPYPIVRADQLDAPLALKVEAAARAGAIPIYAVSFPFERKGLDVLPGRWTTVGTVDDITILRLEPPSP